MEALGRKAFLEALERRRRGAREARGSEAIAVQCSAAEVGQQLCHQLAFECQTAAAAYLVQFLGHANAVEHLRRALSYYSDGTRVDGVPLRDGASLPVPGGEEEDSLRPRTAYDGVREEAYREACRAMQPQGQPSAGSIPGQRAIPGAAFSGSQQESRQEFRQDMMGIAQLERFFGWFAVCLRHLPSERLCRLQDIAQFEPGKQDLQNDAAKAIRQMALTTQKTVNMYCGTDQTSMYKLGKGEAAEGFGAHLFHDIAQALREDAARQLGAAQRQLQGLVPASPACIPAIENWRLFENTAFAQGELHYFNSLRFNSNSPNNLGQYMGVSILSLNSQTSENIVRQGEACVRTMLKYDVTRTCDKYIMQKLNETNLPHMNVGTLSAKKACRCLRVLGFERKGRHPLDNDWVLNRSANPLVTPLAMQDVSGKVPNAPN